MLMLFSNLTTRAGRSRLRNGRLLPGLMVRCVEVITSPAIVLRARQPMPAIGERRNMVFCSPLWRMTALVLVALCVRMFWLDHRAFWLDEYATYSFATSSWQDLVGEKIKYETNPPGYYMLQKAWLVFGSSRVAMRSLPALLSSLVIPFFYLIMRRLFRERDAWTGCVLLATAPVIVAFSREIRGYSALILFACIAIACALWMIPTGQDDESLPDRKRMFGLGSVLTVSITLALYMHNTAVFVPMLLIGFVLLDGVLMQGRTHWKSRWMVMGCVLLGYLPFIWWMPKLMMQANGDLGNTISWIAQPSIKQVYTQLTGVYAYPYWIKPLIYMLFGVGLMLALRSQRRASLLVCVMMIGQPLLLLAGSFIVPMFLVRTLLWASVFFFIPLAIVLGRMPWQGRWILICWITVMQVLLLGQNVYHPQWEADPYVDITKKITVSNTQSALLVCPDMIAQVLDYAAPHLPIDQTHWYTSVYGGNHVSQIDDWIPGRGLTWDKIPQALSQYNEIWIITERFPKYPIAGDKRLESQLDTWASLWAGQLEHVADTDRASLFHFVKTQDDLRMP